jgi:long-chain acyl-CoA synthetase
MSPDTAPGGRSQSYLPLTIASGVYSAARRTPQRVALGLGVRRLTYRQLTARFNQVATAAKDGMGLVMGDHVALFAPNCLEFIEIVCGLAEAGVASAMVPPSSSARELAYICNDSEAKVLFVHESLEETARSADLQSVETLIVIGKDFDAWRDKAKPNYPGLALEEWDVFCIPYTSGTTGNPKGCLLPHRSRTMAFYNTAVEFGCYTPDDRALAIAPLFHGAGFAFALAPIFFGGYCEILPKYDPEEVLRLVSELNLSNIFMVPTHFHAMFSMGPKVLGKYATDSLHTIISNAAPLPQDTKERIVARFGGGVLHETYGSTEAGIVSNLRPADQLRKERCVGLAYPNTQIRLLDPDGNDVAPGEVGEIYTLSTTHFNGYWKMPEATAESFRGSWLTVGDMGRLDDEGYLYLVDRKNDMIITGGVNVFPREIEEVLHTHPAVLEVGVIGVEDDHWGEAVKAIIVIREGESVGEDALLAHCRESLGKYKIPKSFAFIDKLPRNAGGKILKTVLRARAAAGEL